MPGPSSPTATSARGSGGVPSSTREIATSTRPPSRPYLMALWTRFCITCTISSRSPLIRIGPSLFVTTIFIFDPAASGSNAWAT
jgi:hypothetical protein